MKCTGIQIKNILGLRELEIKPGSLTVIEGRNASGKTSVLEAIRSVLSGGHDAELIRKGSDHGEVVLVLEDGVRIQKRIGQDKSTLTVQHPEFGKVSKAQSYLDRLVDSLSLNPVEFLTAPAGKRVDILLEAIPMKVTREQLADVLPLGVSPGDLSGHALQVLGRIGRELYDQRTGLNRAAKEKRSTVEQMKGTLPPAAEGGDWNKEYESKKAAYLALHNATQDRIEKIKECARLQEETVKDGYRAEVDQARQLTEKKIAELRADLEAVSAIATKGRDDSLAEVTSRREKALETLRADHEPKSLQLTQELARAKAMVETEQGAEKTRSFIGTLLQDADNLEDQSTNVSRALEGLAGLKSSLLKDLPIAGLEIVDGQISVGGIHYDRLNEAAKVRLALEIAKSRAGTLGLVLVDGLERLDSSTFAAFKKEASKSKLQFVISRVTDSDFTVTAEEPEVVNA